MSIVKGKNGLSLNIQHDYITLRTPNGNFTTSWSGAKASGKLAMNDKAFKAIDKYIQTKSKTSDFGSVMNTLLDPKVLSSLWSEWNEEVKTNDFVINDNVKFITNTIFATKYPNGGIVKSVSRKNVFITLVDGKQETIGFDYQVLIKK